MSRAPPRPGERGFTLLELVLAIAVFTMLGAFVVYLMRQGLAVFAVGSSESSLQDRTETVLPRLVRDLEGLALPASFEPPPPAPTEEEKLAGRDRPPPPPVDVRLRAGWILPRDTPEGPLKSLPAIYMAWVMDVSEDRSDPLLRRAGARAGPGQKDLVPSEVDAANLDTAFKATGGLREVCYVALPGDERYPSLMTLYQGWRSPVGGAGTLLDPANLGTRKEILERCRPIAEGVLHLEARWRRVFASDWQPTSGPVLERDPYVGPVWDSTRALERTFPLFVGPSSLGDASDDVFPAWVRLEITLLAPTALGLGRGETSLVQDVDTTTNAVFVEDAVSLVGPGPDDRYLKVGGEWMGYRASRVDVATGKIWVDRARRGTPAASHGTGDDVYSGLTTNAIVRLLYRDRFARREGRGR